MKAEDTKKYRKELSVIACKLNDLGARCALRYENDEQTLEDICKVGEDIFEISFKAGIREAVESTLQAIKDEPEFPSDMPDELWVEMDGNREVTQRVMQNTVGLTKKGIMKRLQAKLKEWGINEDRE